MPSFCSPMSSSPLSHIHCASEQACTNGGRLCCSKNPDDHSSLVLSEASRPPHQRCRSRRWDRAARARGHFKKRRTHIHKDKPYSDLKGDQRKRHDGHARNLRGNTGARTRNRTHASASKLVSRDVSIKSVPRNGSHLASTHSPRCTSRDTQAAYAQTHAPARRQAATTHMHTCTHAHNNTPATR